MAQKKSQKGKYKYVTDSRGTRHRVPVDKNGKVPFSYLEQFASQKSPISQKLDKMKVSKTVYPSQPEPILAYQWMKNTGSSDISGLDSPQGTRINYDEPRKYKGKRKKNTVKKKAAPKSTPKATPKVPQIHIGSVGLRPIDMDEKLEDMHDTIFVTKDGKVVMVSESNVQLDEPDSIGAVSYDILERGKEYDGGWMEYTSDDRLKDLEHFISNEKDGMKFKRIVARHPSNEYTELSDAVYMAMAGEPGDYHRIKGKYALANKRAKPGSIKEKLITRMR